MLFGLLLSAVRRSVGLLPFFLSFNPRLFWIRASRAFTRSNSEVVTIYSGRAGSVVAISFSTLSMRSGVPGWSLKAREIAPGLCFSNASSF